MRIMILGLILLLAGCSSGIYNVPPDEYQQQVKTLGVLPLLVDNHSTIVHPDAAEIFALLRRSAKGRTGAVVDDLRRKKGYFDVRLIPEPAQALAETLLVNAKIDESGLPRGYQLNPQLLAELCKDSSVDGLLLLTLQAVMHSDKRWSRNTFETLVTDYNDIMATASVVTADGRVLWEMNGTDATTILQLQYPDFDEAYFNKDAAVKLKFISFDGLERTLLGAADKEPAEPPSTLLTDWLKKVTAALSPTLFR